MNAEKFGRARSGLITSRPMLTGEIRSQVDAVWNAFWTGGISNPLEVIEQITYLLFLRRLDDIHTLAENKAAQLKRPIERRVFPKGKDGLGKGGGRAYEDFRWSRFKNFEPKDMYALVGEHVFPFLRTLGGDDSTYAQHMKGARFTIPTPALLHRVVDLLDAVPMDDRDTKDDVYEYMLGKIASAGQNGRFRTPRHIIRLMVELTAPRPDDVICDPACGTAGFLVTAGEYLRERHPKSAAQRETARALSPPYVPRLRLRQHRSQSRVRRFLERQEPGRQPDRVRQFDRGPPHGAWRHGPGPALRVALHGSSAQGAERAVQLCTSCGAHDRAYTTQGFRGRGVKLAPRL